MRRNQDKFNIWSTAETSNLDQSKGNNAHHQGPLSSEPSAQPRSNRKSIPVPWLAALLVVVSGSIGFMATASLLKLPKVPNCPNIFWLTASASKRLYCAQLEAEQATVDSLLKAIALVEALPDDHPLRPEIDRQVEQWSAEVLDLAEQDFQAGKFKGAIATVRKLPKPVQSSALVQEQMKRWQKIWSEAREVYAEAEQQLRSSNWNGAFQMAVKLTGINNDYWATTKYQEVVNKIQIAREESKKLDQAFASLKGGGVDEWLAAIEQADKISSESYVYKEARELFEQASDKLLDHVQQLVAGRRWQELLKVSNRIPSSLDIREKVADWSQLASAGVSGETGTVDGLEAAIKNAQKIEKNSSVYKEARRLIGRWQLEIEDVRHLAQARELAQSGEVSDLAAAISEARLVSKPNPRYSEAQAEINDWRQQLQTIQDQPILDRARELANGSNISAWQAAIAEARAIAPGRALHQDAQNQISRWRSNIERQEDQPLLDQAISFAYAKNYPIAIETAQQIRSGRALYGEARSKINVWQQEIRAQELIQKAYQLADRQTPAALADAIKTAQQIPSSTEVSGESRQAMDLWSSQLLAIAIGRADFSMKEAISIASLIPSGTDAYRSAQSQIKTWEQRLKPPQWMPKTPLLEDTPEEL